MRAIRPRTMVRVMTLRAIRLGRFSPFRVTRGARETGMAGMGEEDVPGTGCIPDGKSHLYRKGPREREALPGVAGNAGGVPSRFMVAGRAVRGRGERHLGMLPIRPMTGRARDAPVRGVIEGAHPGHLGYREHATGVHERRVAIAAGFPLQRPRMHAVAVRAIHEHVDVEAMEHRARPGARMAGRGRAGRPPFLGRFLGVRMMANPAGKRVRIPAELTGGKACRHLPADLATLGAGRQGGRRGIRGRRLGPGGHPQPQAGRDDTEEERPQGRALRQGRSSHRGSLSARSLSGRAGR
jgi:hypothetical protein